MSNNTIAGNSSSSGALVKSGGPVTNTLLANNAGGNCNPVVNLLISDFGGNLSDDGTCAFSTPSSQNNTPAGLDPAGLRDNGGPTQTIALCAGVDTPAGCTGISAAIDAASPFAVCPPPATDQRGVIRPQDGDGDAVAVCDIGAYEFVPPYPFTGFFAPVDNPPTVNTVKAGQGIPVKFSLGGDRGLDIFAALYPKSQQVACDTNAPQDAIEQTVTAGGSSLSYDPAADTYTYVWKTDKAWAGACRQLIVKLNDATDYTALFKFK